MTTTTNKGVLTNYCECVDDDDNPMDCDGFCWETGLDDLLYGGIIPSFGDNPFPDTYRVEGLPLWNRKVSGEFTAKNLNDFVWGISVRGLWRLNWESGFGEMTVTLYHHDAPTGGTMTVTLAEEEEEEDWEEDE